MPHTARVIPTPWLYESAYQTHRVRDPLIHALAVRPCHQEEGVHSPFLNPSTGHCTLLPSTLRWRRKNQNHKGKLRASQEGLRLDEKSYIKESNISHEEVQNCLTNKSKITHTKKKKYHVANMNRLAVHFSTFAAYLSCCFREVLLVFEMRPCMMKILPSAGIGGFFFYISK